MSGDVNRAIREAAAAGAFDSNPIQQAGPCELILDNCQVAVGWITLANGERVKALRIAHLADPQAMGIRFLVPMPLEAAREIGNQLCDRPNIAVPPGALRQASALQEADGEEDQDDDDGPGEKADAEDGK